MIRELNSENIDIVHDLAHEIWPYAFKDILTSEQIEYMLNWMYDVKTLQDQLKKGHRFFLLEEEGKWYGFIGTEKFEEKSAIKIHKLYVLPQEHGKGLGKKLIEHVKNIGLNDQIDFLFLNVNRFNKAVQFYQHLGFTIEKEENIDIGSGYWMEDYVMKLELKS